MRTTWRQLLRETFEDDFDNIHTVAPHDSVLDHCFDDGYGGSEGPSFAAWSDEYVYFPVVYDGAEWPGRAPRNPCANGQRHVGGE